MAAQAASALDYRENYMYGSAAPVRKEYDEPAARPAGAPLQRVGTAQRAKSAASEKTRQGISPLAALGSLAIGILMLFVVLAQISFNDVARETVNLNTQLRELSERERLLEITYESVIDMKMIEQYARDVLGMSKPEASQSVVLFSTMQDRAEIIEVENRESALRGFGAFISSLTEYFRG